MGMEKNPMPKAPTLSVSVQVRHSTNCPHKTKGPFWKRCNCRKILRVYEGGGSGANQRVSANTRSWEEAERIARAYRDARDPREAELKRLKAEREAEQTPLEQAVALYIAH